MDPVTALVAALAAGATAAAKGVASDAVSSVYAELKCIIAGRLTSLATIEEDPDDDDHLAARPARKSTEISLSKPEFSARLLALTGGEPFASAAVG
jgi:hypothetical protein